MTRVLSLTDPQLLLRETKLFPTSHTNTVEQSLLERLTDADATKENTQSFIIPDGSSPCSQQPATGPYPEPVKSS